MSDESKALVSTEDPYVAMERADEHQVLAEMQGRFIQELVYSFNQGGEEITGLSLAGVRETVRTMNNRGLSRIRISDKEPKITETEDYYQVLVYAEDTANGGGAWGVKRQEKKRPDKLVEGKVIPGKVNVFAMEMALSKAQRNAQRALIPEYFVKAMIEEYSKLTGQVKRMAPRSSIPGSSPAVRTSPRQQPGGSQAKTSEAEAIETTARDPEARSADPYANLPPDIAKILELRDMAGISPLDFVGRANSICGEGDVHRMTPAQRGIVKKALEKRLEQGEETNHELQERR